MVTRLLFLFLGLTLVVPITIAQDAEKTALERGKYPWYDAPTDAARPIFPTAEEPPREVPQVRDVQMNPNAIGSFLTTLVLVIALVILVVVAVRAWMLYGGMPSLPEPRRKVTTGEAARIGTLPGGLSANLSDPRAEARRLRDAGDLAGATVALFIHELRALEKAAMVTLPPGRTARQVVRSISDRTARSLVEPTARLFESALYAGRAPSREAFDAAWDDSEALDRQISARALR